ncbi:hypothetical protein MTR67_011826 [Solanum verrucosum]|uniref:Uncharacterized protein n=1 Tax=Solanum verrucosum TaxID=315347 RepID=A0AAF0TGG7_SOLVR|nr:hypothetical protein MTR67_011826 [Solanum verrucosum]
MKLRPNGGGPFLCNVPWVSRPNVGGPLKYNNVDKMKYSMGMEAKHREAMASRASFYGVGSYDTRFHG